MTTAPHPVLSCDPDLPEYVRFAPASAFGTLTVPWPRCQEIEDFGPPTADDLVVANSHAWPYPRILKCTRCLNGGV